MVLLDLISRPTEPVTVIPTDLVGDLAALPRTPAAVHGADSYVPEVTERFLDAIRGLGIPVGYPREQDGRLVQDLFPVESTAHQQVSTSSLVDLGMHTETAFHPHRPDYVVLLCLRGDPGAATTHATVPTILGHLDSETIEILNQPRFITTVDESFMSNGESDQEFVITPLTGHDDNSALIFDEKLMRGTDDESQRALDRLTEAVNNSIESVTLSAGDLLIIDNQRAVHGRSRFTPRFDGTDRWLRRAMVLRTAPPSSDFDGTLVTTTF